MNPLRPNFPPNERKRSWPSSRPDTFTSSSTTAPHDRSVYMAASRHSPLIDDQWQGEDDHRARHRHREREYRGRRPDSQSPTRRALPGNSDVYDRSRGGESHERSSRYHHRSREHHSHHSERGHRREPREAGREEEAARRRELEQEGERSSRRTRHRERSTAAESKRHRDHESDHRHRSHHHPERRSSHREYASRSERREPREHTSARSREDHPHSSREESHRQSGSYDYAEDDYERGARASRHRHRDRSPPPENEYSSHDTHLRHPSSPGKSHHHHQDRSNYRHEHRRQSPRRDRRGSPPADARAEWEREASPRGTRTSRRSEKLREDSHRRVREYAEEYDSGREAARSRSPGARHSERRMQSTQPIQSILDDQPRRRSPPRPIPTFDDARGSSADEQMREHFPMHGMKASDVHGNQRMPPHIDTRHQYAGTPPYGVTPTSSHHGSPHSGSPYSAGRGGWGGPPSYMAPGPHMNAYSPPHRQNSYPPPNGHHGQYYGGSPHYPYPQASPGYQSPSYRGGHHGHGSIRGGYPPQDRRYSGGSTGPPQMGGPITPTRGRGGHFQNLHWNANGSHRGGRGDHQFRNQGHGPGPGPPAGNKPEADDEDENPFRPSKDFRVEDQGSKGTDAKEVTQDEEMPPPDRAPGEDGSQSKEASKFSFAFKAKPTPMTTTKPPVPDLTQKMKEPPAGPPRKDLFHDRKPGPRMQPRDEPHPRHRHDRRPEGWEDRRGDWREREYDHRWRDDRREHHEYREDRRYDHRYGREPPRQHEKTVETRIVKKTLKRPRDKPQLEAEFKLSDSVYFRKGGNESVVGSGTYGKVYKGIHVFTKGLVALKKIRMEGERDGFPITAVRELKLLQSLRHENVVALHEVMVERNDCFMVFEYLSHDLTGLLNHPTFQLQHAHKKDLARQLYQGLDYLHKRGVLHRDIKAANILVSNIGKLKLADFGLARFYDKRQNLDYTNRVITIWYRPPELLLGETQYGPAVDVWSAACVMVEIFTKHAIFPGDGGEINQLEKVYNILGTPTTKEWPGLVDMAWFELLRPTERKPNTFAEKYKERLTPQAFELLESMFLYDPSKRPSAGDVLEHPYFTTEEPLPKQALELKDLAGDWHEFESKALRRENERKDKEARRMQKQEDHEREKAKRRAPSTADATERDPKRPRPSGEEGEDVEMK